jgi:hypothetical protein
MDLGGCYGRVEQHTPRRQEVKLKCECGNTARFYTTALVSEEWAVDEDGNFIEVAGESEVAREPDYTSQYTCAVCGEDVVSE